MSQRTNGLTEGNVNKLYILCEHFNFYYFLIGRPTHFMVK